MSVDWSKPLQTRGGTRAEYVGLIDPPSKDGETIACVIRDIDGVARLYSYHADGSCFAEIPQQTFDIINVPPRKETREIEAWAVVTEDGGVVKCYTSETAATEHGRIYSSNPPVVRLTGTVEIEVHE